MLLAGAVIAGYGKVEKKSFAPEVRRALKSDTPQSGDGETEKKIRQIEERFYEERRFETAWIDGPASTPRSDALLEALRGAERHGLDPARYDLAALAPPGKDADAGRIAELDTRLTRAFLAYAADLAGWGTSPPETRTDWLEEPEKIDLADRLRHALGGERVGSALDTLAPTHRQYKALQEALARSRKEGDASAVERISMNLERWRWAPHDLGERYVLVNVPAYRMQVYEGEKPVLAMRVIVGKPDTPTPIFSDRMTYVVFSPYWNIPEQILREETLPRVERDPGYLARNQIEVVTAKGDPVDTSGVDWKDKAATAGLRFRQTPGEANALGLVKFIFPNDFNIYLHDTPDDALFAAQKRALSHGCVRVEKPLELAEYVLADRTEWTQSQISSAMHAKVERSVTLKTPLPVHIGYWTAWIDDDGRVAFTDDPYGIDAKHRESRRAAEPRPAPADRGRPVMRASLSER